MTLNKDLLTIIFGVLLLIISLFFPYKAVALIVTVLFFVLAIINPKTSLLILLIYIPIRPLLTTFQDGLKGIADAIIFGALISVVVYFILKGKWKELFSFHLFEYGLFAFMVIGAISALISGVDLIAIIFQYRAFLLMYLIYYIVVRLDITMQDVKRFLWITFFMALIISLHGIIEKVFMKELLIPQDWQEMELNDRNKERVYGLPNNPNDLAVFLTFSFIAVVYLRNFVQKSYKWIIDLSLILVAGVFFLTDSKGMLIIGIMLFILYIIKVMNWKKVLHVLAVIVFGQLIVAQSVYYIVSLPVETSEGETIEQGRSSVEQFGGSLKRMIKDEGIQSSAETSSNSGRLMIIQNSIEVFLDHPLIGTGFGTFGDSATKSFGSPIYEEYDLTPGFYSDGQYTQIIAQTGLLGVLFFAVFLLGMLYQLWRQRINPFAKLGIMVLLFSYVGGIVYNIWEMDIFTLYFYMILGFLMANRNFSQYEPGFN